MKQDPVGVSSHPGPARPRPRPTAAWLPWSSSRFPSTQHITVPLREKRALECGQAHPCRIHHSRLLLCVLPPKRTHGTCTRALDTAYARTPPCATAFDRPPECSCSQFFRFALVSRRPRALRRRHRSTLAPLPSTSRFPEVTTIAAMAGPSERRVGTALGAGRVRRRAARISSPPSV